MGRHAPGRHRRGRARAADVGQRQGRDDVVPRARRPRRCDRRRRRPRRRGGRVRRARPTRLRSVAAAHARQQPTDSRRARRRRPGRAVPVRPARARRPGHHRPAAHRPSTAARVAGRQRPALAGASGPRRGRGPVGGRGRRGPRRARREAARLDLPARQSDARVGEGQGPAPPGVRGRRLGRRRGRTVGPHRRPAGRPPRRGPARRRRPAAIRRTRGQRSDRPRDRRPGRPARPERALPVRPATTCGADQGRHVGRTDRRRRGGVCGVDVRGPAPSSDLRGSADRRRSRSGDRDAVLSAPDPGTRAGERPRGAM